MVYIVIHSPIHQLLELLELLELVFFTCKRCVSPGFLQVAHLGLFGHIPCGELRGLRHPQGAPQGSQEGGHDAQRGSTAALEPWTSCFLLVVFVGHFFWEEEKMGFFKVL